MANPCAKAVRDAVRQVGGDMSDDEADEIIEQLTRRAQANKRRTAEQSLKDAARDLTAEEVLEQLAKKRMARFALLARQRREGFMRDYVQSGRGDMADATRVFNVGEEKDGYGSGASVDALQQAERTDLLQNLDSRIKKAGLEPFFFNFWGRIDEPFERAVVTEMAIRNGANERPTGNARARDAAEIIGDLIDETRRRQNDQGAFIAKEKGYIIRQSHDRLKVAGGFWQGSALRKGERLAREEAAFVQWRDTIRPLLDEARTFGEVDDPDAFLRDVWMDIVTGQHERIVGANDLDGFRPPGSLARKVSARRQLHFRTSQDWYTYHKAYGQGNFMQAAVAHITRAADNTVLMRAWGPSPEAAWQAHLGRVMEGAESPSVRNRASSLLRQAEFDELTGLANSAHSIRFATVGRWLRLSQVLSKLGGMVLSALPDMANATSTMQRAGVNLLDGYKGTLSGISRLQGEDAKQAAALLGVGARQSIGDITSRYAATDGSAGKAAWLQSFFYKLNGFSMWAEGNRRGVGAMLSAHLGQNAGRTFDQLDKATRGQLSRYGLDAAQWDALRAHARQMGDDTYILPQIADELDDTEIIAAFGLKEDAKPGAIRDRRDLLRRNINAYFTDLVATAQTEPRARENARLRWGYPPGTLAGEALRAFLQFKSFPVTVISRHVAPALRGTPGVSPMAGATHLIVMSTILGFASLQSKQITKGLTPRPLLDDEGRVRGDTVMASMLQGGGMGIFGDFLFADYNRFGGGVLATAAGPIFGEVDAAARLLTTARTNPADVPGDAIQLLLRNTPGINLFYTRAALDYLVVYQMQEWASPGYLRRYERRIERERGQRFIVPPSEAVE
ncbi:hypothetical protein [Parvularcula sp. LCG005]|uniref:hypothetical protein n=1 Tax=Parvularcula sp. LCG005 TaxID=3078805 RepID=UPI0029434215|nr:hypothetical protein [Parvularcula sp. LCG005]WOI54298.1 hypothetical protein RUI03_04680 [Parvularcula sp. LCG005]